MSAIFFNVIHHLIKIVHISIVIGKNCCISIESYPLKWIGIFQTIELKPIKRMLDMGIIPVLYGDAVLDSEKGFAILSGDQLVSSLAINFGAQRIVMGGDVDGIYTADPKTSSSAKLIPRVTLEELKNQKHNIEGAKSTDVTGGMLGKMRELIPAIEHDIEALIVNATKPLRVYKALRGEKVKCTVIRKG